MGLVARTAARTRRLSPDSATCPIHEDSVVGGPRRRVPPNPSPSQAAAARAFLS